MEGTAKSETYVPIACSVYDFLEASAVQRKKVRIEIRCDGLEVREVYILDLFSKHKTEFMKAKDALANEEFILRLDDISVITDPDSNTVYLPRSC